MALARACFRHRRLVLISWIVAIVVAGTAAGIVGSDLNGDPEAPASESRDGIELLQERFGGVGAGAQGSIVFQADGGVDDPEVQAAVEELFAQAEELEGIQVTSPYEPGAVGQISSEGDLAGEVAYARVEISEDVEWADAGELGRELADRAEQLESEVPGLRVEIGGEVLAGFEPPASELIGLAFAVLVLIVSFGSVLAMGLPIAVALAGVGAGLILTNLLSNVLTMPEFALQVGAMIGLGVGIDYALFIVTRYREQLHRGDHPEVGTMAAIDTAGRAVVFAGLTVVIALAGLLIAGIPFLTVMGLGAAATVVVAVLVALTLLPALLGFAGRRVLGRRGRAALDTEGDPATGARPPLGERWARFVVRHRVPVLVAVVLGLLAVAVPATSLETSFPDEGQLAEDTTQRKAYDLLAEGFGPGFNGPLLLAAELGEGSDPEALQAVTDAVAADDNVAFVTPAVPNDPEDPSALLWRVIPKTAPQDEDTTSLVNRLRDDVLPDIEAEAGTEISLTGFTAVGVDFSDYLAARLVYFFAAVLVLSFLLLMTVFRSVLVPLKAVIMNLISIGAAYGVVVAVFQWGWLSDLSGVEPAPIEPFIPMMLFAIVFGLSMDYEVFLLSRVKEEWNRTRDSHQSVANGLASTARVITAAAAIMVVVFGSFLLETDRVVKLMGTGLAVAVLLDATVVRMLLVPATMELLGDRNWWLPRWLDRILPKIDVEGHPDEVDDLDEPDAGPREERELAPA